MLLLVVIAVVVGDVCAFIFVNHFPQNQFQIFQERKKEREGEEEGGERAELEGYLQKESGGVIKKKKILWFSTRENRLYFYPSEASPDPTGFIPLLNVIRFLYPSLFSLFLLFLTLSHLLFSFSPFPPSIDPSLSQARKTGGGEEGEEVEGEGAGFEIKTDLRSFFLEAECVGDRDVWVEGLRNCVKFWKVFYY